MLIRPVIYDPIRSVIRNPLGASIGFYVGQLFANGEQGVWYDPSDFSTMFQDSAGTIPVTVVEQPIGLVLDKRRGLVRGVENANSPEAWTLSTETSFTGGQFVVGNTLGVAKVLATGVTPAVAGRTYEITFRVVAVAGSGVSVYVGSTPTTVRAAPGTYREVAIATNTTAVQLIARGPSGVTSAVVDNISVRELPGNHASQTTAAARPVLSARKNLLIKTEQLNDATWIKSRILTTTAEATTAPDGTQTAELIIEDTQTGRHNVRQGVAKLATAIQYTTTYYLKAAGRNFARVELSNSNESAQANVFVDLITGAITTAPFISGGFTGASVTVTSAGNGWWRVSLTATTETDTMVNSWVNLSPAGTSGTDSYTGDGVSGIYIWGAQLEHGPTATRYQRVNTATDYDSVGFPHGEKYDGVDDHDIATTGGGGSAGFFYCTALKPGALGVAQTLWSDRGTNTGYRVRINTSNQLELTAGNGAAFTASTTVAAVSFGIPALLTAWDDGATLNVQINQGAVSSVARPVVVAGTAGFTEGRDNGAATSHLNGSLFDRVYAKDGGITATERANVQNILSTKAGVTLP